MQRGCIGWWQIVDPAQFYSMLAAFDKISTARTMETVACSGYMAGPGNNPVQVLST
jgi:hypothetical protein